MKLLLITSLIILVNHFSIAQIPFGNAIDFDGDWDYASTVNEPVFNTTNGTIEAWIKVRSITPGPPIIGDAFFAKNMEQFNNGDFYMWFESTTGKLTGSIQSFSNQYNLQSNFSFWNYYDIWFHTTFTWGNSGMKLYINGVLQSLNPATFTGMTNAINFYVGTHGYKQFNGTYNVKDFFDGRMDEVRIWNHQRTVEQITYLLSEPLDSSYYSTLDSGLVGYWRFDELEDLGINNDGVDDVRDFSVFHNHLDLTGDTHLVPENIVIPVELVSFTAEVNSEGNVSLNWETATETNNFGFEIQKSYGNEKFIKVGFVEGAGTTTERKEYFFIDENTENGPAYYRLKQIDSDGTFDYSDVVEINVNIVSNYLLAQNYPNPFNPTTKIKYQIPELNFVKIRIYDVLGNEISTLVNEEKPAGQYEVEFSAENLSSGIYYYRIKAGEFTDIKKMLLIK